MKKNPFTSAPVITLCLILICTLATPTQSQAQVYTKTISVSGAKNNEKRDSTFTEVKESPFSISLHSMSQGAYYSAQRAIHRSKITEEYKWITLYLADDKGGDVSFKDAAEFIKYMESHGYKLDSETKERFRTDYVFSKK